MKPVGRDFGFWVLTLCCFATGFHGDTTASAVCLVGAVIFDAIKQLR